MAGILLLNPTPGNLLQIIHSQAPPTDAISCHYRKLPVKKPKFSERKSLCSPISREECGETVGICLVFVRKMIGYLLKTNPANHHTVHNSIVYDIKYLTCEIK